MEYIKKAKKKCSCNIEKKDKPEKLVFSKIDYFKALFEWLNGFKKIFEINPGLYYTGQKYDLFFPVLVTCNYHLTVFLLWRIVRNRNLRILVIDTKGINVWCSSGKGQFNASEILKQLKRYPATALFGIRKLEIILPKLSLSGVKLSKLRNNYIIPRIGPIYMKDIPEYLDKKPLKDRVEDRYKFSLKDRLFTLPSSCIQFMKYSLMFSLGLFILNYFKKTGIYWQTLIISFVIAVFYIIFFPVLPTKKFTLKGLFLALFLIVVAFLYNFQFHAFDRGAFSFYLLYTIGISIWFGLYYTGNSGVSNYSLVKKEITTFLPIAFVVMVVSIGVILLKGVLG